MTSKPLILTFVGMPGAGKSSCVDHVMSARPELPPILYFGGITMDEVARRGLEVNEQNERMVREDIRAKEGPASHAKRISAKIDEYIAAGHTRIVADGLYSWSEYKFFKEKYGDGAVILAIAAPRKLRHERLLHRPIRPFTEEQVTAREYGEIEGIEKGGPIANADYTVLNRTTPEDLFAQLDEVLHEIGF
ncbi:MAG TPA: AAA family ATPase [Candidatus Saccharimonadales bacterium]|nr:AAA family ATPase [Candidatus Saccharimonadales bacterium]